MGGKLLPFIFTVTSVCMSHESVLAQPLVASCDFLARPMFFDAGGRRLLRVFAVGLPPWDGDALSLANFCQSCSALSDLNSYNTSAVFVTSGALDASTIGFETPPTELRCVLRSSRALTSSTFYGVIKGHFF